MIHKIVQICVGTLHDPDDDGVGAWLIVMLTLTGALEANPYRYEEECSRRALEGGSEQNFTLDSSNHQACSSIILFLPLSDTDARCSNAAISLKLKD